MTPERTSCLTYTISHFQELARRNLFPENNTVPHDTDRCVICHPELLPAPPFLTYLDVVTQSVKVRRPRLDQTLVDEINSDLALAGDTRRVTLEALQAADVAAVGMWKDWIRSALTTGMELLSIHSSTSQEFDLNEQADVMEETVESKIDEIRCY